MENIKKIFSRAKDNFSGMCTVSRLMLLIGQFVMIVYLVGVSLYILHTADKGVFFELGTAVELSKLALTNLASGLCVLWGAALITDYLFKSQ